jgi:hypothetical protein
MKETHFNKQRVERHVHTQRMFSPFKTPVKGILDIVLIMTITTLAVIYLGPIVIRSSSDVNNDRGTRTFDSEYVCLDTGRIIKEYLFDEQGEIFGWIDVEYHDNGSFMRVVEHNLRDGTEKRVYYSEENEFLHWYEIEYDDMGSVLSSTKYGADGNEID